MAVPNIFGSATSAIPLSQLDQNFATAITLGNTAVYLGNTTTSLGNVTLTNVTISSGNVSVSTATVGAGSNTAPAITTTGDTNTGIFFPAADTIAFTEGGVESMRIDSSGNVGIGTASPTYKLDVATAGQTIVQIKAGTTTDDSILGFADSAANLQGRINYSHNGDSMSFFTNGSQKMLIDSSGNVGIGTSSPTYKLDVAGFSRGAIVHRAGSYSTGATTPSVSGVTVLYISNSSPTTITNFTDGVNEQVIYLYFNDSNTTINRSNAYLAGGVNFVSTANDMLALIQNGGNWYEISRSVNS